MPSSSKWQWGWTNTSATKHASKKPKETWRVVPDPPEELESPPEAAGVGQKRRSQRTVFQAPRQSRAAGVQSGRGENQASGRAPNEVAPLREDEEYQHTDYVAEPAIMFDELDEYRMVSYSIASEKMLFFLFDFSRTPTWLRLKKSQILPHGSTIPKKILVNTRVAQILDQIDGLQSKLTHLITSTIPCATFVDKTW